MTCALASAITKAASKQTYYTIRFLVDRARVDDAYRAYAYFRWVDDVLDAAPPSGGGWSDPEREERTRFLDRQRALLAASLRGEVPPGLDPREEMLVELARRAGPSDTGLGAYLLHMMRVMEFDVRRRGRLVSRAELDEYTRSLAIAVTEAMHACIGHGATGPADGSRYRAVAGAHIVHMLRDTFVDLPAGYVNVPREVVEATAIGPEDVESDAYRAWVRDRVRLARDHFAAGRAYFAAMPCRRHRLAGLLYMTRFEWLLDTLERNGFTLLASYEERPHLQTGVGVLRSLGASLARPRTRSQRAGPLWPTRANRP